MMQRAGGTVMGTAAKLSFRITASKDIHCEKPVLTLHSHRLVCSTCKEQAIHVKKNSIDVLGFGFLVWFVK